MLLVATVLFVCEKQGSFLNNESQIKKDIIMCILASSPEVPSVEVTRKSDEAF